MLLYQRFRGFFVFILLCKIEQDNALIWGHWAQTGAKKIIAWVKEWKGKIPLAWN